MSKMNSKYIWRPALSIAFVLSSLPAFAQSLAPVDMALETFREIAADAGHEFRFDAPQVIGTQVLVENLQIIEADDPHSTVHTGIRTARAFFALNAEGDVVITLPEAIMIALTPTERPARDLVVDLPALPEVTVQSANGITLTWDAEAEEWAFQALGGVLIQAGEFALRSSTFEGQSVFSATPIAHRFGLGTVQGAIAEGALAQFALEGAALTLDGWGETASLGFEAANGLVATDPISAFAKPMGLDQAARLRFALGAGHLGYWETDVSLGASLSTNSVLLGAEFGEDIPILWRIGPSRLAANLPLLNREGGPFAITLSVADAMPEAPVWDWIDRAGLLPRETGAIDLDIMGDLEPAPETGMRLPLSLARLQINRATLAGAGLDFRATGGLDLTSGAGPSRVDISAHGLFTFLEAMTQSGHLDPSQFAMIAGAIDLFATRTEGQDQLESAIDLTQEGKIMIGGMPLQ